MATGPDEASFVKSILDYAWLIVGALIGVLWKKHDKEMDILSGSIEKIGQDMEENVRFLDNKISAAEKSSTPLVMFEKNRDEVRNGQIQIFDRLDKLGQSLARIEGKLDR